MKTVFALLIALTGFFTTVAWSQERPAPAAVEQTQGSVAPRADPVAKPITRPAKVQPAKRSDRKGVGRSPYRPYLESNGVVPKPVICACVPLDGQRG